MSNNTAPLPAVSFAGQEEFTPYEGMGVGITAWEGIYEVNVASAEPHWSKGGDKALLKVSATVTDPEEAGVPLISEVVYFGVDKNGKSMNRQLSEFLVCIGYTVEQIRDWARSGQSFAIEDIARGCVGKRGRAELEFTVNPNSGQHQSSIKNWVSPERFAKLSEASGGKPIRTRSYEVWASTPAARSGGAAGANIAGFGPPAGGAPALGGPGFAQAGGFGGAPTAGAPNGLGAPAAAPVQSPGGFGPPPTAGGFGAPPKL